MSVTSRVLPVPVDEVWEVLANGFTYSAWVVGTNQIRAVDHDFPAPGTALHYRIGMAPFAKDDETRVVACEPGSCLELEAQAWPVGSARIRLELTPAERDGRPATVVALTEHPQRGAGRLLHNPATDALLHLRNVETLRRLQKVCTGWR